MECLAVLAFVVRGISISICPSSSSATLNGRTEATGDQLPVRGPRNPRSEADRGWLQRLVRQHCNLNDKFQFLTIIRALRKSENRRMYRVYKFGFRHGGRNKV